MAIIVSLSVKKLQFNYLNDTKIMYFYGCQGTAPGFDPYSVGCYGSNGTEPGPLSYWSYDKWS